MSTEERSDKAVVPRVLAEDPQRPMAGWRWWGAIFFAALLGLVLFSGDRLKEPSQDTHFVYLANTYVSMLAAPLSEEAAARREGKVAFELDREPPHRNDWASYREITLRDGEVLKGNWVERRGQGPFLLLGREGEVREVERGEVVRGEEEQRYFVSFPPGPAWLMVPLAAIWGYGINDVWFTIFFGALNVVLIFILLERLAGGGVTGRTREENLWLTGLFGFGTVHLWSAILGQVWFTALIVGITFTVAYLICAIDARRPLLAGCFLAMAFATRTPLVVTAIFFFAFVFFPGGRWIGRGGLGREKVEWALKKLVLFCLPCLAVGLGLLWMNHLRFEDWSEFGHTLLAEGRIGRIQEFGLFHLHFLEQNLKAAFLLLPRIQGEYPYVIVSRHGMSLFLSTPAFLYLLWPRRSENSGEKFLHRLCWVTVTLVAVQHFLYQNTGYEQFGYRFSLDYTAYLIMLLALGRRPLTWVFKACVVAGVIVNGFGAITFKRMAQFYSHQFFV